MICTNIQTIRDTITKAAVRSGRNPNEIQLVAVSKRVDMEQIVQAASCGQQVFGENYIQEAQQKIPVLNHTIRWHFIGHLQSNKARQAVELFDVIETIDRLKIAKALDQYAQAANKTMEILVQVNIGREKQKHGVLPEHTQDLVQTIREETQLKILGLMGMPPWTSDPEENRKYFRYLKELAETLAEKKLFSNNSKVQLSMGMSADYEIAIEEGATLVRVGTAIFGQRK